MTEQVRADLGSFDGSKLPGEKFDFMGGFESPMGTIGLSGDGGNLNPTFYVCPTNKDVLCSIDGTKLHCVRVMPDA